MKKCLTLLFILVITAQGKAQDSTQVQAVDCEQLTYYYADLSTYYYEKYYDDSLNLIFGEWERTCGMSEPLMTLRILYAIEKGNFSEDMYGNDIARYVMAHVDHWRGDDPERPYVPSDYYPYLLSIAKTLQKYELSPLEKVLVDAYATRDEDVLEEMDSTALGDTKLYQSYRIYKEQIYRIFGRFHLSVFGGAWIPEGKIAVLGSHPGLGFSIGSMWQKLSFDLSLAVRFLNAPKTYQVSHLGALVDTRNFSSVFVGIDGGYQFKEFGKSKLSLLAGIGYEAITVVKATSEEANDGKFISTLNLNGGLGYRYYFKRDQYVGLSGKYNLLNYKNRGGTDLSGNAITLMLVYGFH
jgi:hypothetical protein